MMSDGSVMIDDVGVDVVAVVLDLAESWSA